jgi:hypothetical protein
MTARAAVADEGERQRLWQQITREYPRYVEYQEKTERKIPIVVLTPE